jgi:hypothetical protein
MKNIQRYDDSEDIKAPKTESFLITNNINNEDGNKEPISPTKTDFEELKEAGLFSTVINVLD